MGETDKAEANGIKPILRGMVIPHPLQGHITPLMQLSYKLADSYKVAITFVVSETLLLRMKASQSSLIRIVGLSDNLKTEHPRSFSFKDAYEGGMGLESSVDTFLASQPELPNFIISDTFVTWAPGMALKYGIPSVSFVTTNAAALSVMSSTSRLVELGVLPLKRVNGSSKFVDMVTNCIPGIPPLRPEDIPASMQFDTTHYRFQFVQAQFREAAKSIAVLVNSVSEIEKSVIGAIDHFPGPVLPVGPTLILNRGGKAYEGTLSSLWPAQNDCLLWLNKQAAGSVLYVSFGSMAQLTKEQITELAYGLETSNQPFLWVISPHQGDFSKPGLLPDGFTKRTGDRCMIVPWTAQLLVLTHQAIGGFLTHCGWNSLLENLSLAGVPMICWPDAAEQALNAKLIAEVWGVGIKVQKDEDGIVKRDEVKRVVKALMEGETAEILKSKASGMKTIISQAVEEDGSSVKNIERLLSMVKEANIR